MTWKFVSTDRQPIPGIPLQCDDKTFEEAVAAYEAQYGPEAKGSVKRTGLYEHVTEGKAEAPAKEK